MSITKILKKTAKYAKLALKYTLHGSFLTKDGRALHKIIRAEISHIAPFKKAFKQFCLLYPKNLDFPALFIETYKAKNVKAVSKACPPPDEPVILCAVKNGLEKVKAQVDHHRRLGFKHFAYMDNMSSDGTYEWLKGQDDVYLFTVDESYNGRKLAAWRRQAMDILGYDRWYLRLDHDEMFCYPGAPQIPISAYIAYLESIGLGSALAPVIEMYPRDAIYSAASDTNFTDEHCYFDTDTYSLNRYYRRIRIIGGPRVRLVPPNCAEHERRPPLLTVYPLVYVRSDAITDCHWNFPYSASKTPKKPIAFLLHYKFLHSDVNHYSRIIETDEPHASGYSHSSEARYKLMLEAYRKNPKLSLYCESSQKLNSSMDLLKINICDRDFFKGFLSEHGLQL